MRDWSSPAKRPDKGTFSRILVRTTELRSHLLRAISVPIQRWRVVPPASATIYNGDVLGKTLIDRVAPWKPTTKHD